MKKRFSLLCLAAMAAAALAAASSEKHGGPTADEALAALKAGNARYVAAKCEAPHRDAACRAKLATGQAPFAVVLGCSDSRVPPEILFDQGMGDLFIVRTAGNVVDDVVLGSIEYAAEHLGAPLVVVLGHERCGAVKAAVKGGEAPGHIGALVKAIKPSVDAVKGKTGDPAENSMAANAAAMAKEIRSSAPILAKLVEEGKLKVVAARYDLDSGEVTFQP
jgi:carbonic anhydrase